ncbi:MAG: SDR family oxidoreductase [Rhodothermales bacterium]|nr:SDR family oxidoreductase [Rhodothermales bacterium]MBO6780258.1 SDR family oxidoreductase [Rhodothermales bacterium]
MNRCVLITGASRGIGAAAARAFAEAGDRVALVYRSGADEAAEVQASLAGTGHLLVMGDVATEAERIVHQAARGLGGLDVLVNNAAVRGHHPIARTDFADWQADWKRILAVNLLGPADLCFQAARQMRNGGAIVNVSSRGAFRGEPDMPAYGASKAALNSLTQSLALALGSQGIRVSAVAPGFVQTEGTAERLAGPEGDGIRAQSPLGRVATAEEVAEAIVYLAGAEMATGTILDLNGGSYMR